MSAVREVDVIGTCQICGEATPPHSNANRVRKVCDKPACISAARARAGRMARASYLRNHEPKTSRRCSACGVEKPLTREFFYPERRDPQTGEVAAWGRWCKPCKRKRSRVESLSPEQRAERAARGRASYRRRMARFRADPQAQKEARALGREASRRWRRRNPNAARESTRRYRERMSTNPQKLQEVRERDRMARRLRREREGVPLDEQRPGRAEEQLLERPTPFLPALPLAQVMERWIIRQTRSHDEACEELGVAARTLYAWRTGERTGVRFQEADKVLVSLAFNWWDVWFCERHARPTEGCVDCAGARLAEYAFDGVGTMEQVA